MSKEDLKDIALKLIREEMLTADDIYGCEDELLVLREVCAFISGVLDFEREVSNNGENA